MVMESKLETLWFGDTFHHAGKKYDGKAFEVQAPHFQRTALGGDSGA